MVHDWRLYGHRGAPRHLPENTLPSFRRALDDGANALELDVHLTRDGEVVVSHDPDGRRTAGVARRFADATLAEVRSWDAAHGFVDRSGGRPFMGEGFRVPLLDEVIEAFPGVPLNVDVKPDDERAAEAVIRVVAGQSAAARVQLASFHERVVRALRRGYEGGTSLSPAETRRVLLLPGALVRRAPAGATAVQIPLRAGPLRLDTARVVSRVHALGLRLDYWVVNDPDVARRLLALGADGLVSDDPRAIAVAFHERFTLPRR